MSGQHLTTSGYLTRGDEKKPVETAYASGYSIFVKFQSEPHPADGTEFDKLVLRLRSGEQEFGACYLCEEASPGGYHGRLIFTSDVYDFQSIFFKNKFLNTQGYFDNIFLILHQKERITRAFQQYTANVAYDMRVYREFFDDFDAKLRKEPEHVRRAAMAAILNKAGKRFMLFFDDALAGLEKEIKDFNKEEHERHGYYFRKQLWDVILSSEFMTLTNLKPRGYLGDPEMMALIHENDFRGTTTFGRLMHKHPLETVAARAVRNRRALLTRMVLEAEKKFSGLPPAGFKLLSVASGAAYEVRDLYESAPDTFERFSCTLLDQDGFALSEAIEAIADIERRHNIKSPQAPQSLSSLLGIQSLNKSVRTMLRTPRLADAWGRFHFVYSVGLFDYLTPPVAKAVARKLYDLLLPGGELVIGNFHANNPTRWYMEYWMDWAVYYRTEADLFELLGDDTSGHISVFAEESGIQMFLHVKKAS